MVTDVNRHLFNSRAGEEEGRYVQCYNDDMLDDMFCRGGHGPTESPGTRDDGTECLNGEVAGFFDRWNLDEITRSRTVFT
jgi:hypothetical protein